MCCPGPKAQWCWALGNREVFIYSMLLLPLSGPIRPLSNQICDSLEIGSMFDMLRVGAGTPPEGPLMEWIPSGPFFFGVPFQPQVGVAEDQESG